MKRVSIHSAVITSLLLLLSVTACDKRRPGVTRTATGEFVNFYPASVDAVRGAAVDVVRSLDLMLMEDNATANGARVVARNAQDTRVIITIEGAGAESTKGKIRIQPGWNEGLSLRIHQMINERVR
jgi:Protein of unknown function (DUF3568)